MIHLFFQSREEILCDNKLREMQGCVSDRFWHTLPSSEKKIKYRYPVLSHFFSFRRPCSMITGNKFGYTTKLNVFLESKNMKLIEMR